MKDLKIISKARNAKHPIFSDFLEIMFNNFQQLHGDRYFGDDKSIIGGFARLDGIPLVIVGNEKKKNLYNFGMSHPEGFRKALRLFKLAEKFNLPIITFIDTPGADFGVDSEKRGQFNAIARNLCEMSFLKTIIISIIIGEGCSGGALGLSVCDKILMLKNSFFSVIKPESCITILSSKKKINDMIKYMSIVSTKISKFNIINEIINDYNGDKDDIKKTVLNLKIVLKKKIKILKKKKIIKLIRERKKKILRFGLL